MVKRLTKRRKYDVKRYSRDGRCVRCREGGGADNEQGDDDESLPFAPEGVEEAGSRLYADGEDEQYG